MDSSDTDVQFDQHDQKVEHASADAKHVEKQEKIKYPVPSSGDEIRFEVTYEMDDGFDEFGVGRTISTYGMRNISPEDSKSWKVDGTGYTVPHRRCSGLTVTNDNLAKDEPDLYVHVTPVALAPEFEAYGIDNVKCFWYLNMATNLICQYEDGTPIAAFKNFEIL